MEQRKIKNKKKRRSTCHTSEEKYLNGNGVYAEGTFTASTRSHKERCSERGVERREARDRDTQTVGVQSVDPIIVSTCEVQNKSIDNYYCRRSEHAHSIGVYLY